MATQQRPSKSARWFGVAAALAVVSAVAVVAEIRIRFDDTSDAPHRPAEAVVETRPAAVSVVPAVVPTARATGVTTVPKPGPGQTTTTADDTDALIQKLGKADEAPAAADKLLARGGAAVLEKLRIASQKDHNPEVRVQAAAVAAEIADRDADGPTPINLRLDHANPAAVWAALAKQGRCEITGTKTTFADRMIDINAGPEMFWAAVTDTCAQTGVAPAIDGPPDHTLALVASPRNWLADTPHQTVGPYWVGIVGIDRRRTIPLVTGTPAEDSFDVRLVLLAEPKLSVAGVSDFLVESAVDDLGNELAPQPPLPVLLDRPVNHTVTGQLRYPDRPGKSIKEIRGRVVVLLGEGNQIFRVDDVLKKPVAVNPVAGCDLSASVSVKAAGLYTVKVVCDRQEMDDQRWRAMRDGLDRVTLSDPAGQPLQRLPWTMSPDNSAVHFEAAATFVQDRCGEPKLIRWEIASRFKPVDVPVAFHNVPMP